jgi:GNAT superfamily N-acetyltransferase
MFPDNPCQEGKMALRAERPSPRVQPAPARTRRRAQVATQPAETEGTASGGKRRTLLRIRRVRPADVPRVIALDKLITGLAKPRYYEDLFERYGRRRPRDRFFLVAEPLEVEDPPKLFGFIIGEVRAWEFGSAPCGWIFALSVKPADRLNRIGEALFNAIGAEFRGAGVTKVRTMVARDNPLPMLFFRGEGMVAGPYIQLEKELD